MERERGRSGDEPDDEDRDDVIGQGAEQRVSPDDVAEVVGDIDASLLDELDDDTRYTSSVEPALRRDDLDFIQMTGLTAPASRTHDSKAADEDDFDPAAPISFAERGVEDVDFAQDPFANGDDTLALHDTHEFVPQRPPARRPVPRPSNVLSDLSAIVKELESTEDTEDSSVPADDGAAAGPEEAEGAVAEDVGDATAVIPEIEGDAVEGETLEAAAETANQDWAARNALRIFQPDDDSDDMVEAEAYDELSVEETGAQDESFATDVEAEAIEVEAIPEAPEVGVEEIPERTTHAEQDVLEFNSDDETEVDAVDASAYLEDVVRRLEGEIVARKTRTPEAAELLRRVRLQEADTSAPAPVAEVVVPGKSEDTQHDAPPQEILEEPQPRGFFQPIRTPFGLPPTVDSGDNFADEAASGEEWLPADASPDFDSGDLGPDDRSRRDRRLSTSARLLLAALVIVAIAGLGAAAYFGRTYFAAATLNNPDAAFSQAQTMLKRSQSAQDFAAASTAFLRIHEQHPAHDAGAPSLFNAAYALYSTPEAPRGPAIEAYQRATVLFEDFIAQYPEHEKVGRAHSLVARLLYETGDFQGAIDRISDPLQRERDPGGFLGSLRIRAKAYNALGDIDAAAADLHAAADHPDNYTPHRDYVALADMYRTRARTETNPATRRDYQQRVIEELQRAHNLQGLDRDERRAIMNQIQAETSLLASALQSGLTTGETAIPVRADHLETWRPAGGSAESEREKTAQ